MIPQSEHRKRKNSSKINLSISAVVHGLIILGLVYFAARQGLFGPTISALTVFKAPPPEKPPQPPPQRRVEPPKEPVKPAAEPPKVAEAPVAPAPRPADVPTAAAPPAAEVADFSFPDGAHTESDPVERYKGYIEYCLRSKWNRPNNLADDNYSAEVVVNVDKQGNLSQPHWTKGSGDDRWDRSVRDVFQQVDHIDRNPPANFPAQVTIRFDVQQEETEPVMQ